MDVQWENIAYAVCASVVVVVLATGMMDCSTKFDEHRYKMEQLERQTPEVHVHFSVDDEGRLVQVEDPLK